MQQRNIAGGEESWMEDRCMALEGRIYQSQLCDVELCFFFFVDEHFQGMGDGDALGR